MAESQEATSRIFITGMFDDAIKGIAHIMHSIFTAYRSTAATVSADGLQT